MPTYQELLTNIKGPKEHYDLRLGLLKDIEDETGRPIVVYAVDLQKGSRGVPISINLEDKAGFSDLIENITSDNIDVFLHSPGGSVEAVEPLVRMIWGKFKSVRYVVPNIAKSAATLMTLSGDQILMDERSELGPIDPQIPVPSAGGMRFVPAQAILDGFKKAKEIIETEGPKAIPAYLPMLNKYDLHDLQLCENAIELSKRLAKEWLLQYMLKDLDEDEREEQATEIARWLSEHGEHLSHGRGIGIDQAKENGLKILDLRTEDQSKVRDLIWRFYCGLELLFEKTSIYKIYENAYGLTLTKSVVQTELVIEPQQVKPPPPQQPPK
jgi:hypothetical protein